MKIILVDDNEEFRINILLLIVPPVSKPIYSQPVIKCVSMYSRYTRNYRRRHVFVANRNLDPLPHS